MWDFLDSIDHSANASSGRSSNEEDIPMRGNNGRWNVSSGGNVYSLANNNRMVHIYDEYSFCTMFLKANEIHKLTDQHF